MALVKNATWLLAEKVLRIAVGFVVTLAVIRHLGPERYGAYAYALSLVYLALPLARLGLESIVVRELALERDGGRGVGRYALPRLGAGVAAAVALCAASSLLAPDDAGRTLIVVASMLLAVQATDVFELWAQGHALAWRTAAMRIGVIAIAALARVALIAADAGATAFMALAVAEALAYGACAWGLYRRVRRAEDPVRAPLRDPAPIPWREAATVVVTALVGAAYLRIDATLLMWWAGAAQAGLHAAALPVVDALSIVPTVMATVLLPELARRWSSPDGDRTRFWSGFEAAMAVATWTGIAAAATLALAAKLLLERVLGPAYAATVPVVVMLCAAVPLFFQGSVIDVYVYADSRVTYLLAKSSIALVAKVALCAWWIPAHGALGAAAATVVSVWIVVFAVTRAMSARVFAVSVRAFAPASLALAVRSLLALRARTQRLAPLP